MEHDDQLIEGADELLSSLDNGPPDDATLVQLRDWIMKAKAQMLVMAAQTGELTILRTDIVSRIAGMSKAVAVARDSEGQMAETVAMVAGLDHMSAVELLTAYRATAARFRDTFRASFVPLQFKRPPGRNHSADVSDYK